MLSEAELNPQSIPAFSQVFKFGMYKDFTKGWYNVIGSLIVETMGLNAVIPLIVQFVFGLRDKYLRKKDGINT